MNRGSGRLHRHWGWARYAFALALAFLLALVPALASAEPLRLLDFQ